MHRWSYLHWTLPITAHGHGNTSRRYATVLAGADRRARCCPCPWGNHSRCGATPRRRPWVNWRRRRTPGTLCPTPVTRRTCSVRSSGYASAPCRRLRTPVAPTPPQPATPSGRAHRRGRWGRSSTSRCRCARETGRRCPTGSRLPGVPRRRGRRGPVLKAESGQVQEPKGRCVSVTGSAGVDFPQYHDPKDAWSPRWRKSAFAMRTSPSAIRP